MRYSRGIQDSDHLRTKAYEPPSRERPLIYRVGFAVLGCAVLISAAALFFIIVGKPSKNPSDNIAAFIMAALICGVFVWLAIGALRESSKRK